MAWMFGRQCGQNVIFLLLLLSCLTGVGSYAAETAGEATVAELMIVDLQSITDIPTKAAVQVCAGLFNRQDGKNSNSSNGLVYTLMQEEDSIWLMEIEGIIEPETISATDFLEICLSAGVATGYIRYDYESQQQIFPNIMTLAGVLDAIPWDESSSSTLGPIDTTMNASSTIVFDASVEWKGFSPLQATAQVYKEYVWNTTGMAKMNPGLFTKEHYMHPHLTRRPKIGLIDYIVQRRLFAFFLNNGCIPLTREHALMEHMTRHNPWGPPPLTVYGYDDTYAVAGDLFEAETGCTREHSMGQVASPNSNNLSYFSRKPKIIKPLVQNIGEKQQYNASKTYITFIVGDGDNFMFVTKKHYYWTKERLKYCNSLTATNDSKKASNKCFPLSWTVSPHALYLAPDILRWYYDQAKTTGQDFFLLPPSGHLYAYPSQMKHEDMLSFVRETENDAKLLNTSGVVAWEFSFTWKKAIRRYFPLYADHEIVRGLFAVNVPFLMPIFSFRKDEFYKTIGKKTILFKPREWRGTSPDPGLPVKSKSYFLTEPEMAAEVNSYPSGTTTYIYLTSDGGGNVTMFATLAGLLEDHVEIVDHEVLVDLVIQRNQAFSTRDVSWATAMVLRYVPIILELLAIGIMALLQSQTVRLWLHQRNFSRVSQQSDRD